MAKRKTATKKTVAKKRATSTKPAESSSKPNGKSQLTAAQAKALFEAAVGAEKNLANAEKARDKAKAVLSDAVKEIFEQLGSGPFRFKGREVVAGKKGTAYFFKSPSRNKIQEIG